MFGGKQPLAMLRDAHVIGGVIRQAMVDASPEEIPGLERAAQLIGEQQSVADSEVRDRWVHQVLSQAGVPSDAKHPEAVKAVREAAPGLGLVHASQIVKDALSRQ
ncbi:hypothetical protein ACFYPK_32920 [Streptomyces halstedii]|uniref:hypothetical protein n=1 Tax=Streptomyces halstedii TaxID=1944 RepID=UPI00346090FD